MIYIYIFINIYLCIFHIRAPHIKFHSNFVHLKLTCPYSRKVCVQSGESIFRESNRVKKKQAIFHCVFIFERRYTKSESG